MDACSGDHPWFEQSEVLHLRHAQLHFAHQRPIDPREPFAAERIDRRPVKHDVGLHNLRPAPPTRPRGRNAARPLRRPRGPSRRGQPPHDGGLYQAPAEVHVAHFLEIQHRHPRALVRRATQQPSCTSLSTAAFAVVRATENSFATDTSVTETPGVFFRPGFAPAWPVARRRRAKEPQAPTP